MPVSGWEGHPDGEHASAVLLVEHPAAGETLPSGRFVLVGKRESK
jgi:hypothetical protein